MDTGSNDARDGAADRILEMIRIGLEKQIINRDDLLKSAGTKQKGRAAPPLPTFTFEGSGITVKVRRFSPFTLDAIGRRTRTISPPPKPPQKVVNYGTEDEPNFKTEDNLADPEYKEQLAKYEQEVNEAGGRQVIDTIINHAVVVDDIDLDEVEAMRSFLVDIGVPQDEVDAMTDHSIYVKHVCIKTPDDLARLQRFVIGQSMPTDELVRSHEDSFRSDVQGQTDSSVRNTVVRDEVRHVPEHFSSDSVVGI